MVLKGKHGDHWCMFRGWIDARIWKRIKGHAKSLGYSRADLIRIALELELENPRVPAKAEHWGRPHLGGRRQPKLSR